MMNNHKKIEIRFRLQNMRITNFSFIEKEDYKLETNKIHFKFSSGIKINKKNEIILILLDTKIFNNTDKEIELCNLTVVFEFHVIGLKEFTYKKDTIQIPDNLLNHLTIISYSTMRGILFEKCSGTYLSELILPTIDPTMIIPGKHHKRDNENQKI